MFVCVEFKTGSIAYITTNRASMSKEAGSFRAQTTQFEWPLAKSIESWAEKNMDIAKNQLISKRIVKIQR